MLSFIVPIYNVESYIKKCVDSLIHQDYDDYEIILVDDGSTDGSGMLADELASQICDGRFLIGDFKPEIRVIHQENQGLSGARNTGIKAAKGEYICFVDSDDYWQENVLGSLMTQIEQDKLDVLRFNFQNVNEKGAIELPNQTTDPHIYNDYSSAVTDGITFLGDRMGIGCYVTQFIVKRCLIVDYEKRNYCLFTHGILFEDTDWTPRMLIQAKRVASTDRIVYNYLTRIGSISRAVDVERKRKVMNDKLRLVKSLINYKEKIGNRKNVAKWFDGMIAITTLGIMEALAADFYAQRKTYLAELKQMNIFPLSTYHVWPKALRKIKLINWSPRVALWILYVK